MANHCRLHNATAIVACNAIADLVDAAGTGQIIIYTGAEPALASDAAGTEVATCAGNATFYGAAAADAGNSWAEANLTATATDASATGNASATTYFRLCKGDGVVVLQGTVGTTGADLNLNATTIGAGAQVDITALELRVPYNQA